MKRSIFESILFRPYGAWGQVRQFFLAYVRPMAFLVSVVDYSAGRCPALGYVRPTALLALTAKNLVVEKEVWRESIYIYG
jgi:hypothetical protein